MGVTTVTTFNEIALDPFLIPTQSTVHSLAAIPVFLAIILHEIYNSYAITYGLCLFTLQLYYTVVFVYFIGPMRMSGGIHMQTTRYLYRVSMFLFLFAFALLFSSDAQVYTNLEHPFPRKSHGFVMMLGSFTYILAKIQLWYTLRILRPVVFVHILHTLVFVILYYLYHTQGISTLTCNITLATVLYVEGTVLMFMSRDLVPRSIVCHMIASIITITIADDMTPSIIWSLSRRSFVIGLSSITIIILYVNSVKMNQTRQIFSHKKHD
jgi:hypothetical protein